MNSAQTQRLPKRVLRDAHIAALTRTFRWLDDLLGDLRALAGEAAHQDAAQSVAAFKEGAAAAYLDLAELTALRDEVERFAVALARKVEARRGRVN